MEVHLLGPLELIDDTGAGIDVRGKGLRSLLASLAIRANEVVSSDHLVETIWEDDPPENPRAALQVLVSRLRKLVGDAITTRDSGYVLRLSPDDLDTAVFDRLVGEGRRIAAAGLHAEAVERFRSALRLWRSQTIEELADSSGEDNHLASWLELRRRAEDQLMESEILRGRHRDVLSEFERLVEAEPFREQRWALLMLALYRSGRQAEALAAYKRLALFLGEELGIEPSSELSELEERILLHDPGLALDSPKGGPDSVVRFPSGTVTFVVATGDGPIDDLDWTASGLVPFKGDRNAHWMATKDSLAAVASAVKLGDMGMGVGVHVGNAVYENGSYVGLSVHKAGRVAAASHPGQVLLSAAVQQVLDGEKPTGVEIAALGEFRLPGVTVEEALFQAHPAGSDRVFPPPYASPHAVTNLPHQIDTFVGRARELDELGGLMDGNRLVTLTGPGGIGKTRLALQAAADRLGRYEHGVWFVDLTTVNDAEHVVEETARVLGITSNRTIDNLEEFLESRQLLLVVDNCERVIDEAAEVVHRLLKAAADLSVLATSRQRLGIPGEVAWTTPAMMAPSANTASPEDLLAADAVALFAERATVRQSGLSIDRDNVAVVAELCRRLDGIPLAIELAAARVKSLGPGEILDRLDDRFALLTTRDRGVQPRHRTLRAVIEWSYETLDRQEAVLFRRLAVFRGGFTLGQAEAICTDNQLSLAQVVDALDGLADKSLLIVETASDIRRFETLATIRAYAQAQLEARGESIEIARRHASEFGRLVAEAKPHLGKAEGRGWYDRLTREHDNIAAALAWSYGPNGEPDIGVQVLVDTSTYWDLSGRWQEGLGAAEALLALDSVKGQRRGEAESVAGMLAYYLGHLDVAFIHAEKALSEYEELHDLNGGARALNAMGNIATDRGQFEHAEDYYDRAATMAERADDTEYLARILNNRGSVAHLQGDLETASTLYHEALEAARRSGNLSDQWPPVINLGEVAIALHQMAEAEAFLSSGLELAQRCGDRRGEAGALVNAGWVALRRNQWVEATDRLSRAACIFHEIGDNFDILTAIGRLALVRHRVGNPEGSALLLSTERSLRAEFEFGLSQDHDELVALETELQRLLGASLAEISQRAKSLTFEELMLEANSQPIDIPG